MTELIDYDELSDDALQEKLEELHAANDELRSENELLELYMRRQGQSHLLDEWDGDPTRKKRLLTIDEKIEVATSELDAARRDTLNTQADAERSIMKLQSLLSQTEMRVSDLKREATAFKRDVVLGGGGATATAAAVHPVTGAIPLERVVKWLDDTARNTDARIDRLRLQLASVQAEARKIAATAGNTATTTSTTAAEDGGTKSGEVDDALAPTSAAAASTSAFIDFHQLQIENKQAAARLEERNAELARLKVSASGSTTALNDMKAKLTGAIHATQRLRSHIRARAGVSAKLRREAASVNNELITEDAAGEKLGRAAAAAGPHLPTTIDYIAVRSMETELAAEEASWRRKVEITELEVKNARARAAAGASGTAAHCSLPSAGFPSGHAMTQSQWARSTTTRSGDRDAVATARASAANSDSGGSGGGVTIVPPQFRAHVGGFVPTAPGRVRLAATVGASNLSTATRTAGSGESAGNTTHRMRVPGGAAAAVGTLRLGSPHRHVLRQPYAGEDMLR